MFCFDFEMISFLRDWQTLIAGILALIAALIAIVPVWKQLKFVRVQAAVDTRETLALRLKELEERKNSTRELLSIAYAFKRRLFPNGDSETPDINSHWVHGAEQEIEQAISLIKQAQESKQDTDNIASTRNKLIEDMTLLEDCLRNINWPINMEFHDEGNLTKEDYKKANEDSLAAKKILVSSIDTVLKSAKDLDEVFQTEIEKYRTRIRQYDDFILTS